MVDLEQACFLKKLPEQPPQGCSRLYFGAEFCFWRFPEKQDILIAMDWARSHELAFTLVTPVLGEDERRRLTGVLQDVLPAFSAGDEVLISDWGTLELVRQVRDDLEVVLGRALSGQKRGPRIIDMELSSQQEDYFQRGSWHSREALSLLAELGVRRIEQDNLLQGLAPVAEGLKASLHIPYAMVTSSRNCPFRTVAEFGPCPAPCGDIFTLQSTETDVLLYQDGNTQFLRNEIIPENLPGLGIDRIVSSFNETA